MRGLVLGVLALTGLYLATTQTSGAIATALAVPTRWLAMWADPTVPLIAGPAAAAAASPAQASTAAPHPKSGPARPGAGHIYSHGGP